MSSGEGWSSTVWLCIVAGLLVLFGGGAVVYYKVRGLRNNNPGNLKKDSTPWAGLAPDQSDDTFFVFTAPVWGLRAMARVLLNYQKDHGLETVAGMIDRWAPPAENSTGEYVDFVSKAMGVAPNEPFDLANDQALLVAMMGAITEQENGFNPYDAATLQQAAQEAMA